MGYVDTKDTSQNICTWKHEIRLPSVYVCVEGYIYTRTYMCVHPVFQKAEYTAVPCIATDIHSVLLKIKRLENTHLRDIQHGVL